MNVRNIVICLIEHNDKIFVGEGYDEFKQETFYRPLGGGIEFGESAADAAIREFKEEMNTDIEAGSYLHTFENIFTFNGKPGHEIVILLSAKFKDQSIYETGHIICREEGVEFIARWIPIPEFLRSEKILYPKGLSHFLEKHYLTRGTANH